MESVMEIPGSEIINLTLFSAVLQYNVTEGRNVHEMEVSKLNKVKLIISDFTAHIIMSML